MQSSVDAGIGEYFWDIICEEVGEMLHGKFALPVPDDCPYEQLRGKSVMVSLTEDGDFVVHAFDTFEEAARELKLQYVARIYH